MRLLLDTNAYTELRRGDPAMTEIVREASHVFFSLIVAGELLHGFRKGARYAKNRRGLEEFLASEAVTMLPFTLETADRFGRIVAALSKKGRPLPTNDIWIAAQAMETGAELVSYDRHYGEIDGLAWVRPDAENAGVD